MQFVETHAFQYVQGEFTFGFRAIPQDRLDAITNVAVSEAGAAYRQVEFDGTPNTFRTYINDDGDFEILCSIRARAIVRARSPSRTRCVAGCTTSRTTTFRLNLG